MIEANATLQEKELVISQAYFEQKSIHEMIELASRLVGNPVMLVDTAYQCLSCYPGDPLGLPTWDQIISTGYMGRDLVLDMGRYLSEMTDEQRQSAYFYEDTEKNGQRLKKIISGIYYENQVLGGLAFAEYSQPFQEDDLIFCDYLSKVMGSLMYKEIFIQKNYNQNFEQLFWNILTQDGQTAEVLEGRLEALGLLSIQKPYYLIYLDILSGMKDNVDYIRIQLKQVFPRFFIVFFQDSLLLIGNISKDDYNVFKEKLSNFIKPHSLYGCISNSFHSLTHLKQQYLLVRQACSVGQRVYPKENIFEFKELSLYCLLDEARNHFPVEEYLHPAIRTLKAYDKENNTDYRRTLILYLENNLNILSTANQLYIHRNTLSYRLRKISQLLNISLDDKNVCISILLSHLYDELLGFDTDDTSNAAWNDIP